MSWDASDGVVFLPSSLCLAFRDVEMWSARVTVAHNRWRALPLSVATLEAPCVILPPEFPLQAFTCLGDHPPTEGGGGEAALARTSPRARSRSPAASGEASRPFGGNTCLKASLLLLAFLCATLSPRPA